MANVKKQKPREEKRRQGHDVPGREVREPNQKPGQQRNPSNPNQRW